MSTNVINHTTRTVYGSQLQTCRVLLQPLDIKENSTINEALNDSVKIPFQPAVRNIGAQETDPYDSVNDSALINIGYVVIGNGGHVASLSPNDVTYMDFNIHQSTDAAPFKLMPFVCRPIDADLPDSERADYRLRKVLEIDGELYVAYYAKRLDFSNAAVEMVISTTISGKTTYRPFVPTISNLRPTPVAPGLENDGTKTYSSARSIFSFTEQDIMYLTEACINLYGSANEAIISEIGFCSGADKTIMRSYTHGGTTTSSTDIVHRNLQETVAMQVCCFVNTYYQANFGINGLEIAFDIGAIEPLFGRRI